MAPRRSALIIEIPEAEAAVAEHRLRLDRMALLGVPAHVTALFPFVPTDQLADEVIGRVASVATSVTAFACRFSATAWFEDDDVVFLAPDEPEPFVRLTELLWAEFPEHPPYGGQFDEVTPHLTIGHGGDRAALRRAESAVTRHLPISGYADRLTLLVEDPDGRWAVGRRFPLGAAGAQGPLKP
jgi:2'-5' RNA ligase